MKKPDKSDIVIDDRRWITFVPHDWSNVELVDIDAFLEPLMPLLTDLETSCLADCCGLEAFSFHIDDVVNAVLHYNKDELLDSLDFVIDDISRIANPALRSQRLNNLIDRGTLIDLLKHIKACVLISVDSQDDF